jgi:hypothetical protein
LSLFKLIEQKGETVGNRSIFIGKKNQIANGEGGQRSDRVKRVQLQFGVWQSNSNHLVQFIVKLRLRWRRVSESENQGHFGKDHMIVKGKDQIISIGRKRKIC